MEKSLKAQITVQKSQRRALRNQIATMKEQLRELTRIKAQNRKLEQQLDLLRQV